MKSAKFILASFFVLTALLATFQLSVVQALGSPLTAPVTPPITSPGTPKPTVSPTPIVIPTPTPIVSPTPTPAPTVLPTPTPMPVDSDGDLWNNEREVKIGTDPLDACSDNATDSAWPVDINNDKQVNASDFYAVVYHIGRYNSRVDLDTDGKVTWFDAWLLSRFWGQSCSN